MKQSEFHNLIIIGSGASGMSAAISAASNTNDIVILERLTESGKKITATGNGKCNFTNLNITKDDFYGNNVNISYNVFNYFNNRDTIEFFNSLGIICRDKNGYCYPYSNQAASVREALVNRVEDLGITVKHNNKVTGITKDNNVFRIVTTEAEYSCNSLIIACGGSSYPCFGTDGSLYPIIKSLGHTIIKPLPSLVGLISDNSELKTLAGVRHEAKVTLLVDALPVYSEYGEIILNKNGISGIPVLNASYHAVQAIDKKKKVSVELDFFPDYSEEKLNEFINNRIYHSSLNIERVLTGLLNNKLLYVCLTKSGIKCDWTHFDRPIRKELKIFTHLIKNYNINITGDCGFENSQATAGGIPISEINPETLESVKCRNLYFAGEIIDIVGKCGGYNLQWAWSTGVIAGAYAAGGNFDKNKLNKT